MDYTKIASEIVTDLSGQVGVLEDWNTTSYGFLSLIIDGQPYIATHDFLRFPLKSGTKYQYRIIESSEAMSGTAYSTVPQVVILSPVA